MNGAPSRTMNRKGEIIEQIVEKNTQFNRESPNNPGQTLIPYRAGRIRYMAGELQVLGY